jgi:pSer/pThr/pTyr-binding forkhead associated (FHA) protein
MPALILLRGGEPQLTFNLDRVETRVGRGTLNDLVVPDEKVSWHHFVITAAGGAFRLEDTSGRGVTINGKTAARAELSDGDEIVFGETCARFVLSFKAEGADRNTNVDPAARTDILSYSPDSKSIITTRGWLTVAGPGGRRVELSGGVANIGSAEGNQIRLDEKYISGFHCRIYKRGGRFFIEEKQKLAPSQASVFQGMVGSSQAMKEVFELVRLVAASDATVLVSGETGTFRSRSRREGSARTFTTA